jgi:hypothetical protein
MEPKQKHLRLPQGHQIKIDYFGFDGFENEYDGMIIEGLYGFNNHGYFDKKISRSLGVNPSLIRKLCDSNTHENDKVTLIVIPSIIPSSKLKAVVLVPTQTNNALGDIKLPHSQPYRDFYYSIAYEALNTLVSRFDCKEIFVTGLVGYCMEPPKLVEVGNCVVDAIVNFSAVNHSIQRILIGGCHPPDIDDAVRFYNSNPDKIESHRPVPTKCEVVDGIHYLTIDIPISEKLAVLSRR